MCTVMAFILHIYSLKREISYIISVLCYSIVPCVPVKNLNLKLQSHARQQIRVLMRTNRIFLLVSEFEFLLQKRVGRN